MTVSLLAGILRGAPPSALLPVAGLVQLGTVVLTGPTGGLGRALIAPLARSGPGRLVLVGRSTTRMEPAAALATRLGAGEVTPVEADLAELTSVARAGQPISEQAQRCGAPVTSIVCNAGVQPG